MSSIKRVFWICSSLNWKAATHVLSLQIYKTLINCPTVGSCEDKSSQKHTFVWNKVPFLSHYLHTQLLKKHFLLSAKCVRIAPHCHKNLMSAWIRKEPLQSSNTWCPNWTLNANLNLASRLIIKGSIFLFQCDRFLKKTLRWIYYSDIYHVIYNGLWRL